jgi:hypothetical protein
MQAKMRELESLSVEELEARCQAATAKRCALEDEEERLARALHEARERRERERPDSLTAEDEKDLRRSLTIVGELLATPDVLHGGFTLADDDPEEMERGYFGEERVRAWCLDIRTGFCLDVCPGLTMDVTLKTKNSRVRAIVREMITSTESIRDEDKHDERTHWRIDWDYHDRIEVRNPMSSEQYYAREKRM